MNKMEKKISKLRYPYLKDLSNVPIENVPNFLFQIDEIARKVYLKENQNNNVLYSYDELFKIYNKSPKSWKVFVKGEQVLGYIHVEAIKTKVAKELINGEINEDDIKVKDILSDNSKQRGYIHIGSVALKEYPTFYSDISMPSLIAGIIDRIIELRSINPKLHKIIAVAFEDAQGDNHFLEYLPVYGFEYVNKTKDGDFVFVLDLNKDLERRFSNLIEIVSIKRSKYFNKKRRVKKLKNLFNLKRIKENITFITQRYEEIKKD